MRYVDHGSFSLAILVANGQVWEPGVGNHPGYPISLSMPTIQPVPSPIIQVAW